MYALLTSEPDGTTAKASAGAHDLTTLVAGDMVNLLRHVSGNLFAVLLWRRQDNMYWQLISLSLFCWILEAPTITWEIRLTILGQRLRYILVPVHT